MAELPTLPISPTDLSALVTDRWPGAARAHGVDPGRTTATVKNDGWVVLMAPRLLVDTVRVEEGGCHERALSRLVTMLTEAGLVIDRASGVRVVGWAATLRVYGFPWREGPDAEGYKRRPLRTWELRTHANRIAAEIWYPRSPEHGDTFTWHTWDVDGVGGENATDSAFDVAHREVIAALLRQATRAPERWHDAAALVRVRDLPPNDPRRKSRHEARGPR